MLSSYGSSSRFGFKNWKAEDLAELDKKIELYTNNIRIRKLNVEFYKKSIEKMESEINVGLVANAKKDLEKIKLEIEQFKKPMEELQAKKTQLETATRNEATKMLRKSMKDARLNSPITDLLGYYALDTIPTANKVTLLIGNNVNSTKKVDYEISLEIKILVEKLVKRKYYVVFDAESNYAKYISQLAGPLGIPVSAKSNESFKDHQNSVVINNDYLRMKILGDAKSVVISTDSITGIGLFTEGLATHVLKAKSQFENLTLNNWVTDLTKRTRNLGITAKPIKQIETAKELFIENPDDSKFKSTSLKNEVIDFRPLTQLTPENLSLTSIETVLNEAISFAKVMDQNAETGGSVIFGSSREDKFSANLIYQTAHRLGSLGISVATGGAGGAMEIANAGAWNSGGRSIGIPIGGKHTLDTEKNVASSIHTKTITTSGYQERIPALLGEGIDSRKLIIFAPGGDGTIKELATTLVRSAGKFDQINKIVFLDSDYYGPLVTWIQKSDLPQALKEKIVMYNTVEEFSVLAQKLQNTDEKNQVITPRKDQLTYEVKTKIYDDYGGSSFKANKKSKNKYYNKDDYWKY